MISSLLRLATMSIFEIQSHRRTVMNVNYICLDRFLRGTNVYNVTATIMNIVLRKEKTIHIIVSFFKLLKSNNDGDYVAQNIK